jgi:hypothetical protein
MCCVSSIRSVLFLSIFFLFISIKTIPANLKGTGLHLTNGSFDTIKSQNRGEAIKISRNNLNTNPSNDVNSKPYRLACLDDYARNAPVQWEESIEKLAGNLTKPAKNDLEKARILFSWVATHVKYDYTAYQNDNYVEKGPSVTLRKKLGLCGDYCCLLKELCLSAGLEAQRISGLSKGFRFLQDKRTSPWNHAWVAIRIDGRWTLSDVTWASGFMALGNNEKQVQHFEPYWFNVNPKAFIFTHFPNSEQWQLLDHETISYDVFKVLPYLPGMFFKIGFNCDEVFRSAVFHNDTNFVRVYAQMNPVKAWNAPVTCFLTRYKSVNFTIQSDSAESIVLWEDKESYFFKKAFNVFSLDWEPWGQSIRISVKYRNSESWVKLLEYKTKP